ncbi:LOW QUALITY PROTEIN: oxysterol-binding protein 1 [Dermatophagoides farinae]|uniref:LOW QUALITY PROTEIN: oxysterol-binding protein 1 n=1 Tax=Dermatophagoides farinae TaxID=6954 RepID=UPI003F625890
MSNDNASIASSSSLAAASRSSPAHTDLKGWLFKWTNYIKGYQKRYFVLSHKELSYYRNPMECNQSCRGSIHLESAILHSYDSCSFDVSSGPKTFHLRAHNEVEKQNWISAIELAKVRLIRQMDAEYDDYFDITQNFSEIQTMLKTMQAKLNNLQQRKEFLSKQSSAFQQLIHQCEQSEQNCSMEFLPKIRAIKERVTVFYLTCTAIIKDSIDFYDCAQAHNRKLQVMLQHESQTRADLEDLVKTLAEQQSHLEQRAIEHQHHQQHTTSEHHHSASSRRDKSENENTEEEEFYDAEENASATEFSVTFPGKAHRIHSTPSTSSPINNNDDDNRPTSENSEHKKLNHHRRHKKLKNRKKLNSVNDSSNSNDEEDNDNYDEEEANSSSDDNEEIEIDVVTRKSVSFTSNNNNSASSVCGGGGGGKKHENSNDNFDGRVSNTFRSDSQASNDEDLAIIKRPHRQKIPHRPNHSLNLWSIMKNCIGKELTKIPMPVNFNEPLSMLQRMTEEFEYADLLHKAAKMNDPLEQMVYVAVFSVTCYSTTANRTNKPFNPLLGETYECDRTDDLGWKCISEQVSHHPPMLAQHCQARDWNCWREFSMTSKFRGKYLLINPLDITHLEFPASGNHYTWRKVNTTVNNIIVGKLWIDNHGEMNIINHKTGDSCHLTFHPYSYFSRETPKKVTGVVLSKDEKIKWVLNGTWDNKMEACKVLNPTQLTSKSSKPVIETGTPKLIWRRVLPTPEYEKMYNMTLLAVQLNEPEEGVAPTDSRLRPDQRLMEECRWDEANEVKSKLEEKQRAVRRKREEEAEEAAAKGLPYVPYEPVWFKKNKDPITDNPVHMFTDKYWKCKEKQEWSACPDIYLDEYKNWSQQLQFTK